MADRTLALEQLLEARPDDPRLLFGLALEYLRVGRWAEGAETLRRYLERADDEGNAWGRLGAVLLDLGRGDEAADAYRRGIEAARRHGHPSMSEEFERILEELD